MVAAANPMAVEAGLDVLRRGGSAVDAAIAVQMVLGVVEPQASGIGGGGFLLHYDGATGAIAVYDGRETAPAGASPTMFLNADGKPLGLLAAVVSGISVGVPGAVAMLELAHKEHGKLAWATLFQPAIDRARDGFATPLRLAGWLQRMPTNDPDIRAVYFNADGSPKKPGEPITNPALAETMHLIAEQGPRALYEGDIAREMVERVHKHVRPGTLSLADLAAYKPVKREPVCGPVRIYLLCAPPPPSSGVGLIELMMILDRTDIASRSANDPQAWFLFAEASRLMYADRDKYVGDPAFVKVPVAGLIDPAYVAERARRIGATAGPPPAAGIPASALVAGRDNTLEPTGTSHFIVRDAAGNVVSMTTTVESIFGTGRMVDGFFLNNQLTDFSFSPRDAQGRPVANAVAPGKRPRSSMVPSILLTRDGRFAGAIGSAGGNAILAYVAHSLVASTYWNMSMADALAAPNLVARGPNFQGEVTKFSPGILAGLRRRGIDLKPGQGEDSGLTGVLLRGGRIDGAADPRREGVILILR